MSVALTDRVVGANLRWHERAVRRLYGDDVRDIDDNDIGMSATFALSSDLVKHGSEGEQRFALSLRGSIGLLDRGVDAKVDLAVQFVFADREIVPGEDVYAFVHEVGYQFLLGYLRAEMTALTQSVALPPALMPPDEPPWEVAAQHFFHSTEDDDLDAAAEQVGDDVDWDPSAF